MDDHEERGKDWNEIYQDIHPYRVKYDEVKWLFRGQSDDWRLEPGIVRLFPRESGILDIQGLQNFENTSIEKFFSEYHLFCAVPPPSKDDLLKRLMIMQHFSCPTRLLDWSESPFVALYFAVCDDFETDGFLYVASSHVRKFENTTLEFSSDLRKNIRMAHQQGWFSWSKDAILADHEKVLESDISSDKKLIKHRISKDAKKDILEQLHMMNISGKTLFPDVDGLGKWVREKMIVEIGLSYAGNVEHADAKGRPKGRP